MDGAHPDSPATPGSVSMSGRCARTAASTRCASECISDSSAPISPAAASLANDENDKNTHNGPKDESSVDAFACDTPAAAGLPLNGASLTSSVNSTTTSNTTANANTLDSARMTNKSECKDALDDEDGSIGASPMADSRCSSPQSVASSNGGRSSIKSSECKRARVDSIVSSMLHVAERASSVASDRSDSGSMNGGNLLSVNGCKKRKLNQPQQCRANSVEPNDSHDCDPMADMDSADDDHHSMDEDHLDHHDRSMKSGTLKNEFERVRSHFEQLIQLYDLQQQQQQHDLLNRNALAVSNHCTALNLSGSVSPPPPPPSAPAPPSSQRQSSITPSLGSTVLPSHVSTTDLSDCGEEPFDFANDLPDTLSAALKECRMVLQEAQRMLSSKRLYAELRENLHNKLKNAAQWGEQVQPQPLWDDLRAQLLSACSHAIDQCFSKQRLMALQAVLTIRPPSIRSKEALQASSKLPLHSSLANLLDPRNAIASFAGNKNGMFNVPSPLANPDVLPASLLQQLNLLQQQHQRLSSPLTAGGQVRRESALDSGMSLVTPKRRRIKASDEPRRTRTSNRLPSLPNTPAMKATSEMLASIIGRDLNSPANAMNGSVNAQLHMSNPLVPVSLAGQNDLLNAAAAAAAVSTSGHSTNNAANMLAFGSQLLNGAAASDLDLQHLLNAAAVASNNASNPLLNNSLLANGLNALTGGSARASPDSMQNFAHLSLIGRLPDGLTGDACSDVSLGEFGFDQLPLTSTLSPMHLRKAKLMFFYVRYPSSNVLKTYFPDILFNKNNTAQLVKWFSNFR
jgi:hypothetical protein